MKIVVTGTRGIPDIQGGVETHCEELYPRISSQNCEIFLIRRSFYVHEPYKLTEYLGVKLVTLYSPHIKGLEAIFHTFLAVLWARFHKINIIHIHAIGPAILVPFARMLGLKVIFTHHGEDYNREKWGFFARSLLKAGEKLGSYYANEIIVISSIINDLLVNKYGCKNTHLIYNGVPSTSITESTGYISSLGLEPQKYIFTLGRFVEEKGFDLLIKAYSLINDSKYKLVIAGDSDHETLYSRRLKELAIRNDVVLTGFIKGEKLQQLFSHARLFILPSFHEGLPISLLEAMSYGLPVLVSDIPAHKQMKLSDDNYFTARSEASFIEKLKRQLNSRFARVEYDLTPYNWDTIAKQTLSLYEKVMRNLS